MQAYHTSIVEKSVVMDSVYLDHAGAALPPKDLLQDVSSDLMESVSRLGNPHSSIECGNKIDEARALVLHHFKASHDHWDVVFTSGATGSIRMVGELFPFGDDGRLLYANNAHTSALGLRAFAKNAGIFPSHVITDQTKLSILLSPSMKNDSDNNAKNDNNNKINNSQE